MGPADLGQGLLPILLSIRMPVGRMPDTDSRKNRLSQSHHLRNLSWPIFCLNLIYKKREKAIRCMPGKENLSRYQRLRCKLFAISTKHCKLIFTSFLWRATEECVLEIISSKAPLCSCFWLGDTRVPAKAVTHPLLPVTIGARFATVPHTAQHSVQEKALL